MKYIFLFCFFLASSFKLLIAQANTQAFYMVTMPHSVSSFASGMQGVAIPNEDDAMVYNPAKLTFTNGTKISYFRNPYQLIGSYPQVNIAAYHRFGNNYIGFSYENWDWGKVRVTTIDDPDGYGPEKESYDRSFSFAYGRKLTDNISLGAQFRYVHTKFPIMDYSGVFISLGMAAQYELWGNQLNFGASIMNLGPAVEIKSGNYPVQYASPPTQLNIGADYRLIENNFYQLPLNISISKPFDKRNDNLEGQSSFKTLFTDWTDFPNDLSLHTSFAFKWKPLNLGGGFSFSQELYLGNYSAGVKNYLVNYYTHGINIGVEYKGIGITAGYAGVAHNVHFPTYLAWEFPYQTFQFTAYWKKDYQPEGNNILENIILSAGTGAAVRAGASKSMGVEGLTYKADNSIIYSAEAAFYFNNNNALVASLYYNEIPARFIYNNVFQLLKTKFSTISVLAAYRYHPVETFHPLFVQAGAGIYRWNPVLEQTTPRYEYKNILQASAGLTFDYLYPLIILPQIDYSISFFETIEGDAPRMQGHNQFNFLIKVGYAFM